MSFEARYHRFSTIRSMSFLSEKLYGPLQVKHAIYLMLAILFGWRGLSTGNAGAIAFAVVVAFIGLLSAVAGTRTLSFEAKIFMVFYSLFDSLFGSEPKPRHAKAGLRARPRPRLWWGRTAKMLAPALAISLPPASLAVVVVVQSSLEPYAKVALIACIASSIAIPVALGMRIGA